MADLSDAAGATTQSPTATAPSVAGEYLQHGNKRIRLRVDDLPPAKCINPMGARAVGSGGLGCGQD
eukprot:12472501-Alexandrium_andersonii.AAC.1